MNQILIPILQNLFSEFIVVVLGVLFANYIQNFWRNKKYGGWHVQILSHQKTVVLREISSRKAQELIEEPADLAVFLKGVISPYAWIHCDLLTKGKERGLLQINSEKRLYLIDLDKNPVEERETSPQEPFQAT